LEVGKDVSQLLGIQKYEPPIPAELAGKVKGLFPSFLRKTDEERVQNLKTEYEEWKNSDKTFYVTEKLDGSSATFYINDDVFGVCSRNLELLETEGNTFWKVARELDLETKMREFGGNFSLQGELIGEGIQGNPYKIKGQTVRIFNVFDIDMGEYLPLDKFKFIVEHLGLETIPILDEDFKLPDSVDELLVYADAKSVLNPNFDREGVVIRSTDRTVSFKSISNIFLIKEK
jgi:RNA ligase (TIGR02306 family)